MFNKNKIMTHKYKVRGMSKKLETLEKKCKISKKKKWKI